MTRVDFVLVGSGIAGSALAKALAAGGRQVLVLERETRYRDKVRGENMPPWGVAEVKELGVEPALLGAGGHYVRRLTPYDEIFAPREAEQRTLQTEWLAPESPGYLDVGHPEACEALSRAAERSGASVLRGVEDVRVRPGNAPEVTFVHEGAERTIACGLVLGCDGRQSTVRRQLGLSLEETKPRTVATGLLVHGAHEWPSAVMGVGTDSDRYSIVCPRAGGVLRLYLLTAMPDLTRFAGPEGPRRFLDAFRVPSLPLGDALAASEPAGPCATYPMNDAYMAAPFVDGAVLMGDAAGWNDPIIGQGLSVALRDARILRDILLAEGGPPTRDALMPYAEERKERMRRLRFAARVTTDIRCTFTPEGAARRRRWFDAMMGDPLFKAVGVTPIVGPDAMPPEAFTRENYERILAL
jgi:2-polyprenyl-6-methoxyphenol hydroxylase-like FAD-dependent oxidoreductase